MCHFVIAPFPKWKRHSHPGTDGSNPSPSREESCANPVLPGAGRLLARERANEDGRATTRPHRYGGIFVGWLANAASHPGSCRRCAACSYPPWPSMGRTRFRGRDRRANGRRTCTAERQCNSPSRGFLSIRPGHSLDDDGASGFDQLPTIVSLNGDDGPCP